MVMIINYWKILIMKRNVNIFKVASLSLVFLILASPIASAMDIEEGKFPSGSLKDQDYYDKELQKLKDLNVWIHNEVDRILADFKQNREDYQRTRAMAMTAKVSETEEEEAKPQANFLNGEYDVRTSVSNEILYGTAEFSQKQPDQVEISHFKLSPKPFPPFPMVN